MLDYTNNSIIQLYYSCELLTMHINEIIVLLTMYTAIGVARGGHGRAFSLPSLNFAIPSKTSFLFKMYI